MAYTTSGKIQYYLQRTLTSNETNLLTTLLPAIKKWIDRQLNSTFDSASATTRYFDGGYRSLDIDPCSSVTGVVAVNDDLTSSYTYTVDTEYIALPYNETIKTEIIKRVGKFPSGTNRIAVTATFSEYDGAVPEDIELVATILAANIINQGKNASVGGNVASESLEGHSVTYDTGDNTLEGLARNNPQIQSILQSRKEIMIG